MVGSSNLGSWNSHWNINSGQSLYHITNLLPDVRYLTHWIKLQPSEATALGFHVSRRLRSASAPEIQKVGDAVAGNTSNFPGTKGFFHGKTWENDKENFKHRKHRISGVSQKLFQINSCSFYTIVYDSLCLQLFIYIYIVHIYIIDDRWVIQ